MPSAEKDTNLQHQIQSLYEIMQEEKVEEIEIKSPDLRVHIRRKGANTGRHAVQHSHGAPVEPEQISEQPKAQQSVAGDTMKSPINGTFYRSPSPSSPMYVKEGDVVDTGKTLCIVEAMKVMNEIKATEKMKIVSIIAENGKTVEKDQDLFVIEKL